MYLVITDIWVGMIEAAFKYLSILQTPGNDVKSLKASQMLAL